MCITVDKFIEGNQKKSTHFVRVIYSLIDMCIRYIIYNVSIPAREE